MPAYPDGRWVCARCGAARLKGGVDGLTRHLRESHPNAFANLEVPENG